jgi:hypothetical protein
MERSVPIQNSLGLLDEPARNFTAHSPRLSGSELRPWYAAAAAYSTYSAEFASEFYIIARGKA